MKSKRSKFRSLNLVVIIATMDLLLSGQGLQVFAANTTYPMGQVTGKVTLSSSSLGVANATVLVLDTSQNIIGEATTGSDGSYSVAFPQSESPATLKVEALGYQEYSGSVTVSNGIGTDNVSLTGQGNVQGTVLDQNNSPVGGATISVINQSGNILASTTSASNGTYTLSGVPTGIVTLQASVQNSVGDTETEEVNPGSTSTVNFSVQNYGTVQASPSSITGMVTDGITGKPVQGATVTIKDSTGAVAGTATTGNDGSYTVNTLSAGTYSETLSANNYETVSQSGITVTNGEITTMNTTMNPYTGKCLGAVSYKDSNNNSHPVSGATVSVLDPATGTVIGQSVTTDSNGNYSLNNVPVGTYSIEVQANNFADSITPNVAIQKGQTSVKDVTLSADYGLVNVKITDQATNNSVNATVQIIDSSGNPVTGSIVASGQYTFTNVQAGEMTVVVDGDGYIESTTPIVVSSKHTAEADVALSTGNVSVAGTITSAFDNSPVSGATVEALNDDNSIIASVDTGADGTYSLSGIPSDGCAIRVVANGYAESSQTLTSVDPLTKQDFQLQKAPFTDLQGVVEDSSNNPITGAKVTLLSDTGSPIGKTATTNGSGAYSITGLPQDSTFSIQVDADGYVSTTINSVSSGVQDVQLKAATGTVFGTVSDSSGNLVSSYVVDLVGSTGTVFSTNSSTDADGSFKFSNVPVGTYTVQIKISGNVEATKASQVVTSGKTTTENIVLNATTGTIVGSIIDSSTQNAISGAKVTLLNGSNQVGYAINSQSDGSFEVQNVPAGTYTLQVGATGYTTSSTSISVSTAGTTQETISMVQNGATVSGEVTTTTGTPITGASVSLVNSLGRIVGSVVQTNSSGEYTFTNVPADTYTIEVYDQSYKSNSLAGQTVSAGSNTIPAIQLTSASTYTGIVEDQSGNPISTASITLMNSNHQVVKTASTDSNGNFSLQNVPRSEPFTIVVRAYGYYASTSSLNWNATTIKLNPIN